MNKRACSSRIVVRYVLFQMPALVLLVLMLALVQRWVSLPVWFIWGLIAFWIAKDVILFPFTWPAYERSHKESANSMIGLRGIAENRLAPSGYVHIHGELWQAEVVKTVCPLKGEKVCGFMEIVDSLCSCIETTKKVTGTVKVVRFARRKAGNPSGNMAGRLFKTVIFCQRSVMIHTNLGVTFLQTRS